MLQYQDLEKLSRRPEIYRVYSADLLWADEYRAQQMLAYHLNPDIDVSSRNHAFIERSVQWISQRYGLSSHSRVADFGCGPGLYASGLAKTGAKVTGIDFSQNSITYAQSQAAQQNLSINYICANYLNLKLTEQFDLITLIMCDFCALSPIQRKKLLKIFASLLSPHGKILLDVYALNAYDEREESVVFEKNQLNQFWFEEAYYAWVHTFKYEQEKVILDKYSLFSESGYQETVYNWLQYYDLDTLKKELADSGFSISEVYADVCGQKYHAGLSEFAVEIEKIS